MATNLASGRCFALQTLPWGSRDWIFSIRLIFSIIIELFSIRIENQKLLKKNQYRFQSGLKNIFNNYWKKLEKINNYWIFSIQKFNNYSCCCRKAYAHLFPHNARTGDTEETRHISKHGLFAGLQLAFGLVLGPLTYLAWLCFKHLAGPRSCISFGWAWAAGLANTFHKSSRTALCFWFHGCKNEPLLPCCLPKILACMSRKSWDSVFAHLS